MILGINPLAIVGKPPAFVPWKSALCQCWLDATLSPQTVVSTEVQQALDMRNPANVFVRNTVGPTLTASSVGGQPAWVGDGTSKTLIDASFAFPAISTTSLVFVYWVGKGIASATGSNTIWSGGTGSTPSCILGFSGAGVIGFNGAGNTVTTGYTQGTPKRAVTLMSSQSTDRMQWGAASTTGGMGGAAAQSGFSILSRNAAATTFANAAWACGGVFVAPSVAAANALIARIDGYCSSRFSSWSGFVA